LLITLQFVTESGWQSALIRWFTWSDYSHVDFLLADGSLLGARLDGGVKIRPSNYANFKAKGIYQIEAPGTVLDYAKKQLGKPYDARGILNFGLHRRNWRDESAWFCSELVAAAFEQGGLPIVNTPDAGRVTPRDLTLSPLLKRIT
jgi:uncharacterized protein YycO